MAPENVKTDKTKITMLDNHKFTGPEEGRGHANASDHFVRSRDASIGLRKTIEFLDDLCSEIDALVEADSSSPQLRIATHLMEAHLEGRVVTPTSAVAASGVPYATGVRRLNEMIDAGFIDQRPRTATGKSFSLHPSEKMLRRWTEFQRRLARIAAPAFGTQATDQDYYYGGSYLQTQVIQPLAALEQPLQISGGLKVLAHGDPTFMVMDTLKRQFEQTLGTTISQRAFSIDRLHEEALRNAERKVSRYDIIAVDLPWIGEFAAKNVLQPLDAIMDIDDLDPADFHTAGWQGAHWGGRPYGVPAQTTPELLFYRQDLFAEAGLEPPTTTDQLLAAAKHFHAPHLGRYGIAWNAARGTALGHTFMMACADFGQPIVDLPPVAGGYDATVLAERRATITIDTPRAREAAQFLMALLRFSPPDILSMSWYERVRPYAAGKVPLAYGYTLLAPYFESNPQSPAHGCTGFLPHPTAAGVQPIAPVGGYVLGIPANIAPERLQPAIRALTTFTSPEAQKLYVQNGSRTLPRYSVGADPQIRGMSKIFEAVDAMSWNDSLQFWPRPPIPQITEIIRICGEEAHDMLRGVTPVETALANMQARAENAVP